MLTRHVLPKLQILKATHRLAGAGQEIGLWLTALQPDGRAERDAAQQRNGQELAPGQHAVEVLDVHGDRWKLPIGDIINFLQQYGDRIA